MATKPLRMRLVELRHGALLLRDARERVLAGDRHYLQVLSAQLRALVGTGGRGHVPLLINLADKFGLSLPCYGAAGPKLDSEGKLVRMFRVLVSAKEEDPEQSQIDLRQWLSAEKGPWLFINEHGYNPDAVIRIMADKYGGAHYDDKLGIRDLWPVVFTAAPGQSLAEQLLMELAEVAVLLSEYVLGIIEIGGLTAASELQRLGYQFDLAKLAWRPPTTADRNPSST